MIIPVSVVQKFALVMNLEIELFIPIYKTSGDRELEREERTAFVLPQLVNILRKYEEFLLDFLVCVLRYVKCTPLYLLLLPIQQLREQKKGFEEVEERGHLVEECSNPKNPKGHALSLHLGGVRVFVLSYCCLCI